MCYLFRHYRPRLPAWMRDEWGGEAGLAVLEAARGWQPERGKFTTYLYTVCRSATLNLIEWGHCLCRRSRGEQEPLRDTSGDDRGPDDAAVLREVWDAAMRRDAETTRQRFVEGIGVDARVPEKRRMGLRLEKLLRYLRGKYGEEVGDCRSASTRYRHRKRKGGAT